MRTTHTYAILQVDNAAYRDIRARLVDVGHEDAIHTDDDNEVINMHGIALQATYNKVASHSVSSPRRRSIDEPDTETGTVEKALGVIDRYGGIDGAHHKMWVLDQVVRILTGDDYDAWVERHKDGEDGPDTGRKPTPWRPVRLQMDPEDMAWAEATGDRSAVVRDALRLLRTTSSSCVSEPNPIPTAHRCKRTTAETR